MFNILFCLIVFGGGYTIVRFVWAYAEREQLREDSSLNDADFQERYGTLKDWVFGPGFSNFFSFNVDKLAGVDEGLDDDEEVEDPGDSLGDDATPATPPEDRPVPPGTDIP